MRSESNILPRISEPQYLDDIGGRHRLMRYPWKKVAIGAGIFFTLLWLLSPSKSTLGTPGQCNLSSYDSIHQALTEYRAVLGHAPPTDNELEDHIPPKSKPPTQNHDISPPHYDDDLPVKNPPTSPPSTQHPTSFETDPDPSGTTYCSSPHKPGARLVQYALMIDAGSQGSRIHVYKFNNCAASLQLEYEVFVQKRPGLSKYAGNPEAAAESLDELMDTAVRVVPAQLVKCTPVAVKATAGLRLLGEEEATKILSAVRHRLRTKYAFELPSTSADGLEDRVAIMDGKDEGVYAWITANYLLGTIDPSTSPGTHSYAMLDLGGASTQIVFEPTFPPKPKEVFHDGEHKYSLTFAGTEFTLYQHSYLGYGLMKARQSVHALVTYMGDLQAANHNLPPPPSSSERVLANPCISRGRKRNVVLDAGSPQERNITMAGLDVASFSACSKLISLVLAKDSVCAVKPCSFDGAYQPSIIDTFPHGGILTLSYFTDRLQPFVLAGLVGSSKSGNTIPIREIATLAERVCLGEKSWVKHFGTSQAVMDELEDRPETCLDLTFMYSLLRLGYEFEDGRSVRLEKKIDGVELGWALGAGLALIDAQLSCRV